MSEKFQKFARLIKMDAANRTVTGIVVSETPDRAGEIFDYATSKAYFEQWTDTIAKATDGKSVGNVREMHGNSAAGKLLSIMFDDDAKSIEVVAKVVDDAAWLKCEEGVYAGFSMGGNYVRKWDDGALKRYTGKPSEISLVDLPCIPDALFTDISKSDATFDLTKADGTHELRKFVTAAPIGNSDDGKEAAGAVAKGAATIPAAVAQAFAPEGLPAGLSVDDAARAVVIHKRGDTSEAAQLLQAASVVIAKAAPQRQAQCEALQKGLYTVRSLADCLMSLSWVQSDAAYEAAQEGDNSPVPAMLRATMEELGKALVAMTQEEVGELLACANKEGVGGGDLAKSADAATLQKAFDAQTGELRKAAGLGATATLADVVAQVSKMHAVILDVAKAVDLPTGASWADLAGLAAPVDESAELTKAHKVIDEATTALTKVAGERDALLQKVAKLEAAAKAHAAAPAVTTASPTLYAVDKAVEFNVGGQQRSADVVPITKGSGETDDVATAIKKAQRAEPTYVMR